MDHDSGYKLLFSHPQMVADLLRDFVHESWVSDVDFGTLERVSGSYVAEDLRDREDDIVWRVRWRDRWAYIYLLLEFQSTVDHYMAVRLLVYVGLLYQDLIKSGQVAKGNLLPPVVPMVLYNGRSRWTAALEVTKLIEPATEGLERYRPQMRYLLLEERAFSEPALAPLQSLVAGLFRLENARTADDVQRILRRLQAWFTGEDREAIERAFLTWFKRVLLPAHLPGVELPEANTLQEINTMLAERVKEWTEQWKQEGHKEGRQQGTREGELAVLKRLVIHRFGPLPDWVEAKLQGADTTILEIWAERILEAKALEEVFRD